MSQGEFGAVDSFSLQDSLESALAEDKLPTALAYIFVNRIRELGVSKSSGDFKRFKKAFKNGEGLGTVNLPLSKKRALQSGLSEEVFAARLREPVSSQEINSYLEFFEEAASNAIQKVVLHQAATHMKHLREHSAEILEEHRAVRGVFINHLNGIWGRAIDQFEVLVGIAREVGDCALSFVNSDRSGELEGHKIEAMFQLYGRACHIGEEVSVLLANGLADGAQARWRSLHEIQVVLKILCEGDEHLSQRYLEHHDIDLYLEAKATQLYGGSRLHSVHPDDLGLLSEVKDELVGKYGKDFICPYGWASELLGYKANRFSDLEKLAGAEYIRPFYKAASSSVHASSRGTLSRLGSPPNFDGVLSGSSSYGLFSPATGAAHSLVLAAVDIAQFSGSVDAMAMAASMKKFSGSLNKSLERAFRVSTAN